jgi:hypothetical protein
MTAAPSDEETFHIPDMDLGTQNDIPVSDLQDATIFPTLWYRLHVLVFDLQHFNQRADSKERLENVSDTSYIGMPYFKPEEAVAIKNTVVKEKGKKISQIIEEELHKRLDRRNEKRINSGDFRVCAAHDLAPIIGSALGIDLKRLDKDKKFLDLLNTGGLNSDGDWRGLSVKSFAPRKRRKGKGKH